MTDMRSGCPCTVEGIEPCSSVCSCANPVMSGGCERCAAYGSLEQRQRAARQIIAALRRSDLAQTEIKGHMRMENELRAELKLGPHITGAAPAYTGEGVSMLEVPSAAHVNLRKGRAAIYERAFQLERELALAQARLAELEKDAARYRWLRSQDWDTGPLFVVKQPTEVRLGTDCPSRDRLDEAIDIALKSSA